MALEKELATYEKHLPDWKEYEGKFVLVHGDEVVDFFSSYDDAIKDGYRRFGLAPFLVKQVNSLGQAHFVTRLMDPQTAACL